MVPIGGLVIGQAIGDFRVVAIDPELNMVQAEDSAGSVLIDSIDHFIARRAVSEEARDWSSRSAA